ncbi:MAG TPA: Asp-tRNA(Asn)/Glu-tRNA(Gln) amidotransferase subunit GatC [Deltaproteobacteria bacterium]|nr:Asp-tRNA(Asn)/Glu-tRNA(Gln) amidotransferase subunit GatC [Deltaproteobacteria bacterium]
MAISVEDVEHVAELARLELTDGEKRLYASQLQRILEYVEKLSAVETDGVEPTFSTVPGPQRLREDRVEPSLERAKALENGPDCEGGTFRVPRIIE